MKKETLQYVLDVLPKGRIPFYYFKDYYAIQLLSQIVNTGTNQVGSIRKTPFAKLLDRPLIKNGLKQWGDGKLSKDRLAMLFEPSAPMYRISWSSWGTTDKNWRWGQISRKGYNLVVQLNFNNVHNKDYHALFEKVLYKDHPFKADDHPTQAGREMTIAWARVDLAEDFSYALIEEIQNDWIRFAKEEVYTYYSWYLDDNNKIQSKKIAKCHHGFPLEDFKQYFNQYLKPLEKIWAEAMLAATIQFLWDEIGVDRIFYHTHETGARLKDCTPPRSIYTKLPKKFCFQETEDFPAFLGKRIKYLKKKIPVRFFLLEI